MKEPRSANRAGSREESVRPGTSPEPAPAQAVLEDLSGLADISSRISRLLRSSVGLPRVVHVGLFWGAAARQPRRSGPVATPAPLPAELRQAIASPLAGVRAGAVQELAWIQRGPHVGMALAARLALEELTQDDSGSVAAAATAALAANASSVPPAPPRPELALSREYLMPQPLALSDQRAEEIRRTISLSTEDVEAGLASFDPNMRVPAYIQLQARPDSRYIAQLINCFWLESYLASSQKETRPLWQLIVAVQLCSRNGLNDESLKRRLIFTMRSCLAYLEADETVDIGGECKERLREVLGRIESH